VVAASKPRQRNRKRKERGLPSESTGTDPIQIEDASQESQTRTGNEKAQARRDSEVIERDAEQPEAGSEPTPAGSSKKPRPRARLLVKAKIQTPAAPVPSPRPQNTDEILPAVSEATTAGTVESAHAPLPGEREDSREDTQRPPRKRPNPASHEPRYVDKRRKSNYIFMHLRVLADKT
jgi:hypothetical protein